MTERKCEKILLTERKWEKTVDGNEVEKCFMLFWEKKSKKTIDGKEMGNDC